MGGCSNTGTGDSPNASQTVLGRFLFGAPESGPSSKSPGGGICPKTALCFEESGFLFSFSFLFFLVSSPHAVLHDAVELGQVGVVSGATNLVALAHLN